MDQQCVVGQNIRFYRKQQKLTQDALADILYMDRAAISRYENGTNGIMGIDILLRFCAALQITPNDLLLSREKTQGSWYERLNKDNQEIADKMLEGLFLRQEIES